MLKPQNIYDNEVFFSGYKSLRDHDTGLNGILEIPAMRACLPPLQGKVVTDLGCGFGDFVRFTITQGAEKVTGLEISQKMLIEAKKLTHKGNVLYIHAPMETFSTDDNSQDLIVSSLAIHYVEDYAALCQRVFNALKPGGIFLFSVEHPMCTALASQFEQDAENNFLYLPVDRYQEQSSRSTKWFVDNVIKYHRTIETYVSTLIECGFVLNTLKEPKPIQEAIDARPELSKFTRYAPFLILKVVKPQ